MAAWPGWEQDVLRAIGAPLTAANVRFLSGWHAYELSNCTNNPLNTTLSYGASTRCNAAGVQSYPSKMAGTEATARTLLNGNYSALVAALRSGDPYRADHPEQVAADLRTWGTPNFAGVYLGVVAVTTPGGIPPPLLPVPPTPAGVAARAHNGWADMRHAVNRSIPTGLARSQGFRRAAARVMRRRYRGVG